MTDWLEALWLYAFSTPERSTLTFTAATAIFTAVLAVSTIGLWRSTRKLWRVTRIAAEHIPHVERAYISGGANIVLDTSSLVVTINNTERRLHLLERLRLPHPTSCDRSSKARGTGRSGKDMYFPLQHTISFPMSVALMRRTRSSSAGFGIGISSRNVIPVDLLCICVKVCQPSPDMTLIGKIVTNLILVQQHRPKAGGWSLG
jgi:hypothetical protein